MKCEKAGNISSVPSKKESERWTRKDRERSVGWEYTQKRVASEVGFGYGTKRRRCSVSGNVRIGIKPGRGE